MYNHTNIYKGFSVIAKHGEICHIYDICTSFRVVGYELIYVDICIYIWLARQTGLGNSDRIQCGTRGKTVGFGMTENFGK